MVKKILIGLSIAIVVLVGGFFAFNTYIYQEKQGSGNNEEVKAYAATLSGVYECLPHRNTSGPQTMECAFGLKTDTGEYYAVDTSLLPEGAVVFKAGERVKADGYITPIEMLSADYWQKYDVEGIFSVQSVPGLVVTDFEGEADPSMMSIFGHSWTWIQTTKGTTTVAPKQSKAFTLELTEDGRFSASTDCNRLSGSVAEEGDTGLVFSNMISTKMFCEGSQETVFAEMLEASRTYRFTSRGEFILTLSDGREMTFR